MGRCIGLTEVLAARGGLSRIAGGLSPSSMHHRDDTPGHAGSLQRRFPLTICGTTLDATVYVVALLVSVASGFLFGAVPVGQTLRTDPYQVVRAGSTGVIGRRLAIRDVLRVGQVAICAVLVTASIVAVRGLVRSVHSHFGFEPNNAMLADTDLAMAGYIAETGLAVQKRMVDTLAAIPGAESVGLINELPLSAGSTTMSLFTDKTVDLRPATTAAHPLISRREVACSIEWTLPCAFTGIARRQTAASDADTPSESIPSPAHTSSGTRNGSRYPRPAPDNS
jgi:hypothetical protein